MLNGPFSEDLNQVMFDYLEEKGEDFFRDLLTFLRFPSVSALPEHEGDCRRAAEFLQEQLYRAGLEHISLIEGNGHPVVYADWLHAAGKPTVILYGYYDVQSVDPLDEWRTSPFEPTFRDDCLYARGTSENKSFTLAQIQAVGALLQVRGTLPVNVRFLLEGDAQTRCETLESYLSKHAADFAADTAIICDSDMFAPDIPTICVGTRGLVYGEIHMSVGHVDLHSGQYGGVAPNAIQGLVHLLSQLKDPAGQILIPHFYDQVKRASQQERSSWSALPIRTMLALEGLDMDTLDPESSFSVPERMWARPTFEVHGIRGGFIGQGAKTVIPARCTALVSMRLVPDQTAEGAIDQLRTAISAFCPKGFSAEFRPITSSPPEMTNTNDPSVVAAQKALLEVFRTDAVVVRSGSTIAVVSIFHKLLNLPSVLIGFRLPDDNTHAPNEKVYMPNVKRARLVLCRLLEILGT